MKKAKEWKVGRRTVALARNGVVLIGDPDGGGYSGTQFTLATGLPGLMGLIEVLQEVEREIREQRRREIEGDAT